MKEKTWLPDTFGVDMRTIRPELFKGSAHSFRFSLPSNLENHQIDLLGRLAEMLNRVSVGFEIKTCWCIRLGAKPILR